MTTNDRNAMLRAYPNDDVEIPADETSEAWATLELDVQRALQLRSALSFAFNGWTPVASDWSTPRWQVTMRDDDGEVVAS
jgi:hypothetical protein